MCENIVCENSAYCVLTEWCVVLRRQAQLRYVLKARPKDKRYAHRVHGASLATQWKYVWTDDTTISTDSRVNEATRTIDNALAAHISKSVSDALETMQKDTDESLSANQIAYVRNRALHIIPSDSMLSRLSNLVLSLEEIAVSHMRNITETQIRRRGAQNVPAIEILGCYVCMYITLLSTMVIMIRSQLLQVLCRAGTARPCLLSARHWHTVPLFATR